MYRRLDNYDVAHDWANSSDSNNSASAGNMYHAGGAIYSYGHHFMIAKHVWNEQGDHAVLFTERTYSRTTSKHVTIANGASSHIKKLYVPDAALTRDEVFSKWQQQIVEIAHHIGNARKPAAYVLQIERVYYKVQQYANFFSYEIPEALAKAGAVKDADEFYVYLAEERALYEKDQVKRLKERIKLEKKALKDWRLFKTDRLYSSDGLDYLRFNAKTGCVETTQRIDFALPAGHDLYEFINRKIADGGCAECDLLFLDRYKVLEINDMYIRVGCHRVTTKEINRFAKQQGWQ